MAENKKIKDSELAQNYINYIVENKINYYDEKSHIVTFKDHLLIIV